MTKSGRVGASGRGRVGSRTSRSGRGLAPHCWANLGHRKAPADERTKSAGVVGRERG